MAFFIFSGFSKLNLVPAEIKSYEHCIRARHKKSWAIWSDAKNLFVHKKQESIVVVISAILIFILVPWNRYQNVSFYSFQWGFSSSNCIKKLQLRTSQACWYQFSLEHKVTKCCNFAINYDVCNGISNGTSSGVSETQLLQYTVASSKPAENTDTLWFLLSDLYLRWLHLQYFIYSTIVFLVCH